MIKCHLLQILAGSLQDSGLYKFNVKQNYFFNPSRFKRQWWEKQNAQKHHKNFTK